MWYPSSPENQDKTTPDRATSPEASPDPAAAARQTTESKKPAAAKAAAASNAPGPEYWLP